MAMLKTPLKKKKLGRRATEVEPTKTNGVLFGGDGAEALPKVVLIDCPEQVEKAAPSAPDPSEPRSAPDPPEPLQGLGAVGARAEELHTRPTKPASDATDGLTPADEKGPPTLDKPVLCLV